MKTNILLLVVAALIFALAWFVREPHSTQRLDIVPVFDRTGQPMMITTHTYDSVAAVTRAYRQHHGIPARTAIPSIQGFAVWHEWPGTEPEDVVYRCDIHSVRPTRVDDNAIMTLGHELAHCLYGNYHDIDPALR